MTSRAHNGEQHQDFNRIEKELLDLQLRALENKSGARKRYCRLFNELLESTGMKELVARKAEKILGEGTPQDKIEEVSGFVIASMVNLVEQEAIYQVNESWRGWLGKRAVWRIRDWFRKENRLKDAAEGYAVETGLILPRMPGRELRTPHLATMISPTSQRVICLEKCMDWLATEPRRQRRHNANVVWCRMSREGYRSEDLCQQFNQKFGEELKVNAFEALVSNAHRDLEACILACEAREMASDA